MSSKNVELNHGFKYHYNNDEVEAKFITISAFSMKQMELVAPIKEIVMKSMGRLIEGMDLSNANVDIEKVKSDAENTSSAELMSIVAMNCGEGDYGKLLVYMQKLLTSGVAYIDESDVKFSGIHWPNMNPNDFENLCGEYIGNFIVS